MLGSDAPVLQISPLPLPDHAAQAGRDRDVRIFGIQPHLADFRRAVEFVARHSAIDAAQILGPGRSQRDAWARHVTMWLVHRFTPLSSSAIGRLFDRDHVAVLHAYRVIEDRREAYPRIRADLDSLYEEFRNLPI